MAKLFCVAPGPFLNGGLWNVTDVGVGYDG